MELCLDPTLVLVLLCCCLVVSIGRTASKQRVGRVVVLAVASWSAKSKLAQPVVSRRSQLLPVRLGHDGGEEGRIEEGSR